MMAPDSNIAIVQQETETEEALLRQIEGHINRTLWDVGRDAALWLERFAGERTLRELSQLAPAFSEEQYRQYVAVWKKFSAHRELLAGLSWSHFYVALNWDDAITSLQMAREQSLSVAEMRRWRQATTGHISVPEGQAIPEMRTAGGRPPAPKPLSKQHGPPIYTEGSFPEPVAKPLAHVNDSVQVGAAVPVSHDEVWNVNQVLVELRKSLRMVEKYAEPIERDEVSEELMAWLRRLKPSISPRTSPTQEALNELVNKDQVIDAWNKIPGVRWCDRLTHAQAGKLQERLREGEWRRRWKEALKLVPAVAQRYPEWEPSIGWFLNRDTMPKLFKQHFVEHAPGAATRWKKPTVEEVAAYVREIQAPIDPREFFEYYEANGWVQGKAQKPIKNWKACVQTWVRQREQNSANQPVHVKSRPLADVDRAFADLPPVPEEDVPW